MLSGVPHEVQAGARTSRAEIGWMLLAVALVPLFANTFLVWSWLSAWLPAALMTALPFALAAAIFVWALHGWRQAHLDGRPVRTWLLVAAALVAGVALALPDPAYPAKRIHVVEYIVLALVVRRALAYRLGGAALTAAAAAITGVLGIHDELLQGLNQSRGYGLADIAVNAIAAVAGALIGHALALFETGGAGRSRTLSGDALAAALAALAAAALLAIGLARWVAGPPFPTWMLLPVLAAGCVWLLLRRHPADGEQRALAILVALVVLTTLPPVVANVAGLDFG